MQHAVRHRATGPVRQALRRPGRPSSPGPRGPPGASTSTAPPASPTLTTTSRASDPGALSQPSNASTTASRSGNTSGWSQSALRMTATSGRKASKLPAYSSASTTNASPLPQRAVAGGRPALGGQERADERAGIAARRRRARGRASRRSWTCHGSRRSRRAARRASRPRRRRPAATPRPRCPPARAATSSGWSGATDVSAFVTPSLETIPAPARPDDVIGVVRGRDDDSGGIQGRRVRRRRAGVAAGHDRSGSLCEERRGRGAGASGTDDVDAAPRLDRARGAGRREAPTGLGGAHRFGSGSLRAASRSRSSSNAAAALARLFAERSPPHTWRRTTVAPAPATAT